jgi:hypothetical protein
MRSTFSVRVGAAAVTGAVLLTPALAAPAFAATSHSAAASHHKGKPAKTKFAAVGTLAGVDAAAGSITMTVKGGNKDLRGSTLTLSVAPGARIRRDDNAATLAELQVGDKVAVAGTRSASGLTAARVNAEAPEPDED